MSDAFLEVFRHLPQITIARAFYLLGDEAGEIDSKARLRIVDYLAKKNRYNAHQAYQSALRASQGQAKAVPVVSLSAQRAQGRQSPAKGTTFNPSPVPDNPVCPDIARDFLNALGRRGLDLKTIRGEVEQIIIQKIDTFTIDADGIRSVPLTPSDYRNQHITTGLVRSGFYRQPWTAKHLNGTYGPVMMGAADLQFLIEHGTAPNKEQDGQETGDFISLGEVINTARGAAPNEHFRTADLPQPWRQRYLDLKSACEIEGTQLTDTTPKKLRRGRRSDFAALASRHSWTWLSEVVGTPEIEDTTPVNGDEASKDVQQDKATPTRKEKRPYAPKDRDAIRAEFIKLWRTNGLPVPSHEEGWKSKADVHRFIADWYAVKANDSSITEEYVRDILTGKKSKPRKANLWDAVTNAASSDEDFSHLI